MMLKIRQLCKKFGTTNIFEDFNLTFPAGSCTGLIGPNGCGKTTLLNIIAGITLFEGGDVEHLYRVPLDISYIFQNYKETLLPWRSCLGNLRYPLEIRKIPKAQQLERAEGLLDLFHRPFELTKYPYQLSGGQQQLLAFIRALVTEPRLILADEPFSALDMGLAIQVRRSLQTYLQQSGAGLIFISHSLDDAISLADRIVILSRPPCRIHAIINNQRSLDSVNRRQFLAPSPTREQVERLMDEVICA